MHRARAFFFVCAGIFLLALTYHLGARSAGAQLDSDHAPRYYQPPTQPQRTVSAQQVERSQPGGTVVCMMSACDEQYVLAANGDYWKQSNCSPLGFSYAGNVFSGGSSAKAKKTK